MFPCLGWWLWLNNCSALLCHTWKDLCFSCGNIALLSAFGARRAFGPTLPMWWLVVLFSGKAFCLVFFFIRWFVEESSICMYLEISEGWANEAQMAAWPETVFILEDLLP